ncbi:acid-sensing ion channel 1B-like [Haliotis rufescens]|uniref:acid-sensing ion channel 1B-like n=1 Tax=Haliotis rufescens TaxID=6454 RepID=UPI00201F4FBF|nr:acid-sensing ion channel 1B-like [Haliotis rufescens]
MKVEPVVTLKDGMTLREEILSQWKDLWRDFLRDTSLHGCKKRHKVIRVAWTVLLLTKTGICLKTLADLYSRYYSYNFITKITRERKQQIRFPAITFCNPNTFDISQQNLTKTELNYLRSKGPLAHMSPANDWYGEEGRELDKVDYVKFWEDGAYNEENMFEFIYFKHDRVLPERLKYNLKQDQRCFTFNANADIDTESGQAGLFITLNIMQETYLEGVVYEAGTNVNLTDTEKFQKVQKQTTFYYSCS